MRASPPICKGLNTRRQSRAAEHEDPGARRLGSPTFQLRSWATYLTCLCLSVFIYKWELGKHGRLHNGYKPLGMQKLCLCYSHHQPGLEHTDRSYPRAPVPTAPSAWRTLPPHTWFTSSPPSSLCSNVTSSARPFQTKIFKAEMLSLLLSPKLAAYVACHNSFFSFSCSNNQLLYFLCVCFLSVFLH